MKTPKRMLQPVCAELWLYTPCVPSKQRFWLTVVSALAALGSVKEVEAVGDVIALHANRSAGRSTAGALPGQPRDFPCVSYKVCAA